MLEQMKLGDDFLPELDASGTKKAVEEVFDKYRIYKFLTFEEREATTTQSYQERFHGPTNVTSDQTADIAIHNVDGHAKRKAYCERVERAVNRLPRMERFLIEKRYMAEDAQYITDLHVYNFDFSPPISYPKYKDIRWRAFYKLALHLDVQVMKVQGGQG